MGISLKKQIDFLEALIEDDSVLFIEQEGFNSIQLGFLEAIKESLDELAKLRADGFFHDD